MSMNDKINIDNLSFKLTYFYKIAWRRYFCNLYTELCNYEKLGSVKELKNMLSTSDAESVRLEYNKNMTAYDKSVKAHYYPELKKNGKLLLDTIKSASDTFNDEEIKYVKKMIKKFDKYTKLGTVAEIKYIIENIKNKEMSEIEDNIANK